MVKMVNNEHIVAEKNDVGKFIPLILAKSWEGKCTKGPRLADGEGAPETLPTTYRLSSADLAPPQVDM